jgi:ABC-type transport system substrate-binding protein
VGHDDYLKFARNDRYWGGRVGADTLVARIIPEPSTKVAEFENGTVDVLAVPEGETRDWEQTDERPARLVSAPGLRLFYVAVNTTRGPLKDARVRRRSTTRSTRRPSSTGCSPGAAASPRG